MNQTHPRFLGWLVRYVQVGELAPLWFAPAWSDYSRQREVMFLMPFHLIAAIVYHAWWWFRHPYWVRRLRNARPPCRNIDVAACIREKVDNAVHEFYKTDRGPEAVTALLKAMRDL